MPFRLRIRQAAFLLSLRRPWHHVTLEEIAREAGLPLSELGKFAPSKVAILSGFSRDIDNSMLANLAKQPPSGGPHDRLFDVVLRRLEIMGPYREVLASILRAPAVDPGEVLELFSAMRLTTGWMLAAAGVEADFHWRGVKKYSLLHVYWRVLQTWVADDDPGLARTMAMLDRRLREAEARAETLRTFGQIAGRGRRMAAAFWNRNKDQPTGELMTANETAAPPISFDDFLKVDIRAGTIVDAQPFPEARKPAFKLWIDLGADLGIRRSSAQIVEYYALQELTGRQVACVVNFPPRQIGKFMSEVLTLGFPDATGKVVLVAIDRPVSNGSRLF